MPCKFISLKAHWGCQICCWGKVAWWWQGLNLRTLLFPAWCHDHPSSNFDRFHQKNLACLDIVWLASPRGKPCSDRTITLLYTKAWLNSSYKICPMPDTMIFCPMQVRLMTSLLNAYIYCLPNLTRPNQPPNLTLRGLRITLWTMSS